mgnify:FL=1
MSGVSAENSRRARKHVFRYAFLEVVHYKSFLPYILRACYISRFAFLHSSLNHGASVLPHLLGFLGLEICISLTAPAITASCNRNSSTAAALSSLQRSVSFTRS